MKRFWPMVVLIIIFTGCATGTSLTGIPAQAGAPQPPAIVEESLQLKTGDGLTLAGLLARPAAGGPFPAVMVNHGGDGLREEWQIWTRKLAEKGYVALAMTFRGFQGSEGTETYGKKEVEDILTALTFLKGLPYVDKDKLGIFGFSKGGFNALLASTRSHDLKAVAVWGAWADMVAGYRWSQTQRNHPSPFIREAAQRHERIIGGTPEAVPEEWRIRSAINHVENVTAAVLILHGGKDSFSPVDLVLPFAEALQRLGRKVEVKVYPGEDHGLFLFTPRPARARAASQETAQDVWDRTVSFFDRTLKTGQ
jgi:dipeptidyl aminopeptidase/acylaminoacyl peptidase